MPEGMEWTAIPDALLEECSQLVKANSIEGNKKNNITIIYTPHANVKVGSCADAENGRYGRRRRVFLQRQAREALLH